jgi:polysaccharide chain length determinant protein (PEP-CTERM system associated)
METTYIVEIVRAVWRELIEWRAWLVGVFIVVALAVLGVGMFWPEKYQTSTMLYADKTNIIASLLEGRAEITNIDHSEQARELIYTRRMLQTVAEKAGLLDGLSTIEKQEEKINALRKKIEVKNEGNNYFRITYLDNNQERSFSILNAVVDTFIGDASERKRTESRNAYEFIEQQVVAYKRQLLLAEEQLKEFKSKNLDGTRESVNSRINELRLNIEELKLTISEIDARQQSIKDQLQNETMHLKDQGKLDEQRRTLDALKNQLDVLRMSYQETYPNIISLKEQIKAQELVIEAMQGGGYTVASMQSLENPLYEELRKSLAEAQVELKSQRNRMASMKAMLDEEYKRAERIASKEAELSELVRDYDVNREIYEEMLGRKEKARLSMALDVEEQGVSFRVQEPPVFPLQPSGLRFVHFAMAAPLVGLIVSIGLVVAYVLLDPRVRSPSQLAIALPENIEILAVVPHVHTVLGKRLLRADMIIIFVVLVIATGIYAALVWVRLSGLI